MPVETQDRRMYALCGTEAIVIAAAAVLAFFVRYPTETAAQNLAEFWWLIPLSVGLRMALFWVFGLYGWVWYYMGVREVRNIAAAVSAGSVVLVAIALAVTHFTFPATLLVVDWLIVMALVGGERLSIRLWRERGTKRTQRMATSVTEVEEESPATSWSRSEGLERVFKRAMKHLPQELKEYGPEIADFVKDGLRERANSRLRSRLFMATQTVDLLLLIVRRRLVRLVRRRARVV